MGQPYDQMSDEQLVCAAQAGDRHAERHCSRSTDRS